MGVKTVLIAHRQASVRDRFAVAIADARHLSVGAASAADALHALAAPIDLALIDLGMAEDPVAFLQALRDARAGLPVVVFSGTVRTAAAVVALTGSHVTYLNEYAAMPQILPALAPHLFPDSFNRRASTRVAIGVPVSYRAGSTIAGAVTLDVGRAGVAIRTMNPFGKGTAVHVRFQLPGTPGEIGASGHVAWTDRNLGMGVQFDSVSPDDQRALDAFVEGVGS